MKTGCSCFLGWILLPVKLLWKTAPSTDPSSLGLSFRDFSPNFFLSHKTFKTLPSPFLFTAKEWSRLCISHSLTTLQFGFFPDHASPETPCKEIINALLLTKCVFWRFGDCWPSPVNPILRVPGSILLDLLLHSLICLGVTVSYDLLLCLTPKSCVPQSFSFFLFFHFPFSSLDSYRFVLSSPQIQLPL